MSDALKSSRAKWEDLTDYISYKVAAAVLDHDSRWERFMLSKYVAIQLTEDFFAPRHSLVMPDNITRNIDVPVDRNISLAQVYEYWFITGGFPALKVSNTALSFELQQFSAELWPLRLSSKQGLPPFLFAQILTMPPKDSEVFVNLNFSSFFRVNYDTTTWLTIFSQIGEHPDRFSAVGRAQLVSDFCYFYAHDQVDHGAALKEVVVDMVYRNSEYFELCDWHLFWCHSTIPATFSQLLKRLALGVTRLFDTDAAFGCRTGQAARSLNAICDSVFGAKCI
ncbi:hypothetical protein NECAME_03657 [Necator americanus]|uniref:ERAP1-like C-terminal domain-containing protein n=1 Tax=Necator americanus TaxID=51031 RepID=W2T2U8_NECAM|nr:hypothetical protein NECAME_03657 [Necator americanus]ETN75884.1 hypothetical protein NECAME_03657 [Necator americanus]